MGNANVNVRNFPATQTVSGTVAVAGALSSATTAAVANLLQVSTAASVLYKLIGYNNRTATQWIQIFDLAATPDDALVPLIVVSVLTQQSFEIDFPAGRVFAAGIFVCNSTTDVTKTLGSADCIFDASFTLV